VSAKKRGNGKSHINMEVSCWEWKIIHFSGGVSTFDGTKRVIPVIPKKIENRWYYQHFAFRGCTFYPFFLWLLSYPFTSIFD
jgi:hypothetical protein